MEIRTDLAMEARELWRQSAGEQTRLPGVWARETERKGVRTTVVRILNDEGAQALGKPVGTYKTLELEAFSRREPCSFERAARALARQLRRYAQGGKEFLVVGLGNRAVTPDAVGPETLRNLIVTRHLKKELPAQFGLFGSVSAAEPGVLGSTGVESLELVRGVAERVRPDVIFVVDALAAGNLRRVCSVIQLADTGIVPGSGIGNSREAFSRETLGAPVVAIGVPTVADAAPIAERAGIPDARFAAGMLVTPRDVDARIREISRVIGYGLDLALHPGLTAEEIPGFLR